LVIRDGLVSAVNIYKNKFGLKCIGMGTDGTPQGKLDYYMLIKDDIRLNRMWSEVSGAPEHIMKKLGALPVPNKYAEFLTEHIILQLDDDGYHYVRLIRGIPYRKIIYGKPSITSKDKSDNINIEVV
jgi:hypothetical protein